MPLAVPCILQAPTHPPDLVFRCRAAPRHPQWPSYASQHSHHAPHITWCTYLPRTHPYTPWPPSDIPHMVALQLHIPTCYGPSTSTPQLPSNLHASDPTHARALTYTVPICTLAAPWPPPYAYPCTDSPHPMALSSSGLYAFAMVLVSTQLHAVNPGAICWCPATPCMHTPIPRIPGVSHTAHANLCPQAPAHLHCRWVHHHV